MGTTTMEIRGDSLIGLRDIAGSSETFHAWNPATGKRIEGDFHSATQAEVDLAARLASEAFPVFSLVKPSERAAFLRRIAARIEALAEQIIERAHLETALPKARLQSEAGRTCNQLRLFATVVEEGSWVGARIDRADAQRKPIPKPDVRSMLQAIGPVVVFGASNFPLAFSVAGGDTASALAAGNPVIVKAHPAHPGTSELVGRAIRECVREEGLPEGTFSLLFNAGTAVGKALVEHPLVKAGGFTGSTIAGRALMDLAAKRPDPIPFYAEMGSTNPVFLLPGALAARGKDIAAQLHGSFTLGSGQFCTKPGLVFVPEATAAEVFRSEFREKVAHSPALTVLTSGIQQSYAEAMRQRASRTDVRPLAHGERPSSNDSFAAEVAVFETDVTTLLADRDLESEVFGPASLLITFSSKQQILQAAQNLRGHLTATIHGTEEDLREFAELVEILKNKVGRIVFNGYPTGVEVCHAMVHGGPYPASTDGRSTSVGTQAIFRFARPVCYQDFPNAALPDELKNENPLRIWRLVDGKFSRE
jgi:alpha-ketoglutaric semialdehyde dehydrogenase